MVKRVIFDLDNTLIMWRDSYKDALKNIIEKYDLNIDYLLVDNVIEDYENYYSYYSKDNMISLINEKFNLDLDVSFIDDWLVELGKMSDVEDEVVEVLDYLNQKYELVVLTNFFRNVQIERMRNVGIDKYFQEIYGGDKYIKPSIQSFKMAMGVRKPNECLMIGDGYNTDIEGAINVGLQAIMITNKDIESTDTYIVIHDIKELKEML